MQEQISFTLSPEFLNSITLDQARLQSELKANIKAISDLLIGYHFKTRGRVFNVSINESSIELISESMGKFTVYYSIGHFNACADVDFSDKASMEMLVDINPESATAIITGEYIPEREPDEF